MGRQGIAETVIRPSLKFIQAGFAVTILLLIGAVVVHYQYLEPQGQVPWLPAAAALLLLWPLSRFIRRLFTKFTIRGDKLYSESGALSKQTRIIQIPKIQDVRVHQSLGQRMLGVGDLSIETAGEGSRLSITNVDNPAGLAEQILELVQHENDPHAL